MLDESWRQLESLYHAAAARPASDRAAFIADACGDDVRLRRELESLFAASSDPGLLDAPGTWSALRAATPPDTTTRVGHTPVTIAGYPVIGRLGAGGMGEVYRARDARLERDVAIKILPLAFVRDRARLTRFEREARALAALSHPNIGAIYGIEDAAGPALGTPALILELIEGETLAERVARGPIPVQTGLEIAAQIADALEAAHEKGIVHRDLKPANIKLTPDGVVKVLDFGLALISSHPDEPLSDDEPTLERTAVGSILGTAPYMSPEQARGEPVDRRTDIWAFGCVLFEMLTGRRAFAGDTPQETLAEVLERDVNWDSLPPGTPANVRRLLGRMLIKSPRQRLRDVGDARIELEDAVHHRTVEIPAPVAPRRGARAFGAAGWVSASMLLLALLVVTKGHPADVRDATPRPPVFVTIPVGAAESNARDIAVSPDGAYVAYIAGPPGDHKTYLRSLAKRESRVLTEVPAEVSYPFFSPDSQWLAYFDSGKLKKVSVAGGAPITLASAPVPRGGAWTGTDTIVFSPAARSGLYMVPAAGGTAEPLTTVEDMAADTSHRYPSWVTGSDTIVYTAEGDSYAKRRVLATSITTRKTRVLLESNAEHVRYAPSGHLTFIENGRLVVAPFDVQSMQVTGPSTVVLDTVGTFAFSSAGLLVFGQSDAAASGAQLGTLVWVDRDGRESALPVPAQQYLHPRLSPDGRRLLVQVINGTDRGVWMHDLRRGQAVRFTFGGSYSWPVWTPDGRRVLFAANQPGTQWDILARAADGSGGNETILAKPLTQIPRAVSPDGRLVAFTETDPLGADTLWTVPVSGGSDPQPLLDRTPGEMMPSFSPDNRWVAYVSYESGRNEVYVRGMNTSSGKWQVSENGGVEPVWSRDGRELFFRMSDTMLAVKVETSPTFSFGKARSLFNGSYGFSTTEAQNYDVTPDGRRFVMLKPRQDPRQAQPLEAVVNWFDDLRQRAPAAPAAPVRQ